MLYTVWVGGTEVNDHYLDSIDEARLLARAYIRKGYTDVFIEVTKRELRKSKGESNE